MALLTSLWHGDRHTSPFALGGWSHSQWRQKPHTGDVKDPQCPYESLVLPGRRWHPKGQGSAQLHRGHKAITSTLPVLAPKGSSRWGSVLWLWLQPGTSWPQLLPGARTQPQSPWCSTQNTGQTRSKASYTPHNKAAEELTPAFSFSSVYISVKYIIYSSIRLIVIYYSLELLLSFPYFDHIYASNFAYRSYGLEFVIEVHRIKLK